MSQEREQILSMLHQGAITAEEAERLLRALGPTKPGSARTEETPVPEESMPLANTPVNTDEDETAEAPPEASAEDDPARQVLDMLSAGDITAEEANRLLEAMSAAMPSTMAPVNDDTALAPKSVEVESVATVDIGPADSPPETAAPQTERVIGDDFIPPDTSPDSPPENGPDMDRFRRLWRIPLAVSVIVLAASGMCLSAFSGAQGLLVLGVLCVWPVFLLAILGVLVSIWSRHSTWVHVRVREHNGHRFAISLPLPVSFLGWGVGLARSFVNEKNRPHIDMAAEMLAEMEDELKTSDAAPLIVDVNEEDGDSVQVYIG